MPPSFPADAQDYLASQNSVCFTERSQKSSENRQSLQKCQKGATKAPLYPRHFCQRRGQRAPKRPRVDLENASFCC